MGPESYRSKFRIFDAGSSHHGGAVLRQQLATPQASATLAAACYQPTINQTPQEDCPTPTHPHATIFYHTYYIHMWNFCCMQIPLSLSELSDNAHTLCVMQYNHTAMLQQQYRHTTSTQTEAPPASNIYHTMLHPHKIKTISHVEDGGTACRQLC